MRPGVRMGALALLLMVVLGGAASAEPPWSVYFSPRGGVTDAIVAEITRERASVWVQAYAFTSRPIAAAVIAARARGLDVRALIDKRAATAERYVVADQLRVAGIPVWIDGLHQIAHNKILILGGLTVITGSFNFTWTGEHSNAENIVIIRDAAVSALYAQNWLAHVGHSIPYRP